MQPRNTFCPACNATLPKETAAQCATCGFTCPEHGWPRDLLLDTLVDGDKYRIERIIGAGGFSKVYRVSHTLLENRVLAMKVLHTNATGDRKTEDSFINEMKILSELQHPNVVHVYEVGRLDSGQLFILMELLEGDSLEDLLQSRGPFPPDEVIHIGIQIASALETAHNIGVLHRDLKPDNILLSNGHAKVIDFGIAKIGEAEQDNGFTLSQFIGTPLYMAPEQFAPGAKIDARLDIYQLGALLYSLLTGLPPYPPEPGSRMSSLMDIVRQHEAHKDRLGAQPASIRSELADTHTALNRIIGHMLSPTPEIRPQSTASLVAAFKTCQTLPDPQAFQHICRALPPLPDAPAAPSSFITTDHSFTRQHTIQANFPLQQQSPLAALPKPLQNPTTLIAAAIAVVIVGSLATIAVLFSVFQDDPPPKTPPPTASNTPPQTTPKPKTPVNPTPAVAADAQPPAQPDPSPPSTPNPNPTDTPFVKIEPGTTPLGTPRTEKNRRRDEHAHRATINYPFFAYSTELTQAQWNAVLPTTPSFNTSCGNSCPVERVSWFDTLHLLNTMSIREGLTPCYTLLRCNGKPGTGCPEDQDECTGDFTCEVVNFIGQVCNGWRLPTETEWEYMTRANNEATAPDPLNTHVWYAANSTTEESDDPTLQPAAKHTPNPWGLHDTLGNVLEWTWDAHDRFAPPRESTNYRADHRSPLKDRRTARGCAFNSPADDCTFARRNAFDPALRSSKIGVRPVRSAPKDTP